MSINISTETLLSQLSATNIKMGDLKKMAKEIKRNHDLAMELWASGQYYPRMLAVLIMDKKLLTQDVIDQLDADLQEHEMDERLRISEWLMANQLMKSKPTIALLERWEDAESPLLRRLYWYHQARLRWTGKIPHDNAGQLLDAMEARMESAEPEVQWAMNFAAAWIGVYEPEHRPRCIALGEKLGLYKDDPVPHNCTPNYLPEFIRIEVAKRAS